MPANTPAITKSMAVSQLPPVAKIASRTPTTMGPSSASSIHQTELLSYRRVIWKTCHICLMRPGSLGAFGEAVLRAMVPRIPVRGRQPERPTAIAPRPAPHRPV